MTVTIPLNNISSAYTELDNKKPFEVLMANPSTLMRTPSEGFAKLFKKLLARVVVEIEASIVDNKIEITNFAGVVSSNNGHHYLEFNSKVILDSAMWDKDTTIKIFFGIETIPNDTIAGNYPLDNLKIYAETQDIDELLILTVDIDADGNLSNLVLAPTSSISAGGGGGASSFVDLTDTPDTIEPNKLLIGNQDGTGIVQIDQPNDCSVINIIPEIQTKLYPSQQVTTQDIQNIIDARIQMLETIEPAGNIGIIYKCIRADAGEVFPINKGIIEYIKDFTSYYNTTYKTINNEIFQINKKYNIDDINNIIVTEYLDSDGNSIGSIQSESFNKKRVNTSDGYIWDYDEINGYWVALDADSVSNYFMDGCGKSFLYNSGTDSYVRYRYFDSTSANTYTEVTIDTPALVIDGWNNPKFLRNGSGQGYFLSKPNDIFNPYKFIRYDRDNNGTTEYLYTVQQFVINENYELVDTILLMQSEPIVEVNVDDYAYLFDISQDNSLILTAYYKPLEGDSNRYYRFFALDEDGVYKKIDTRLKCRSIYSAHLIDNQSIAILRGYSTNSYPHFYKLNLKPSLICMADRTVSEVQDIDLSSFGTFELVRYISGIGSNQSEMDIVAVDDSNLKAISILDNEVKQDVAVGFTPTMLSSSSNYAIVADDSNVKIFDMSDGSTVKTISDSNINNVDVYSTTHYGISKDTNYKLYNMDDDSVVVDITVNDVGLMVLDKKKEFIYYLETVIDNGDTTITVSRYDASTGDAMIGNTALSYSSIEYNIIDIEINGNNMLLTLKDGNNNYVIKAYCVEDIENVKEICSYDAHYINDFKWTTNMNNIICLKDNVTLTSLSMES